MKHLIILIAICCTSNVYAQDKADIHNQLFDKLFQHEEVIKLSRGRKAQIPILKDDDVCNKIKCELFPIDGGQKFSIYTHEELFQRTLKNYIVIDKIDDEKKTLSVYVKFKGSLMSNNLNEDFKYVMIKL